MNVLLVTESYPPQAGGSGWSTHQLARSLAASGHTVRVLYLGHRTATYQIDTIPVFELKRMHWGPAGVRLFLQEFMEAARLARIMARWCDVSATEVVHSQHRISSLALSYLGNPSGRLISTVRDYWPICDTGQLYSDGVPCSGCDGVQTGRCLAQRYPIVRYALPIFPAIRWARDRRCRALKKADGVIAVSRFVASKVAPCARPGCTFTVPNMVEQPQPSGPAGRRPRALFVGKLETAKGAHLLPGLARKLPSGVELVVAGEGKLTQRLVEENLGNVRLLGWADRQTLQELMNTSSVLVFPSLWPEPLSRVLLEACAAGLPTVAFPVGGNPEIIVDDVNGYLVSSVDEMAMVASRIVSDGTLRGRLQEGAYHIARSKFSVDSVLPRVIQIYTSDIWVNSQ